MVSLTFVANVTLGSFLVVLAAIVARGSPDRVAARWLAAFLGLVGVNYLLNGAYHSPLAPSMPPLASAASLATNVLDPVAFVVFALVVAGAGRELPARTVALIAAPPLAFLTVHVAIAGMDGNFYSTPLGLFYTLEVFAYYIGGFAILARCYLRGTSALQLDRLGMLVVAFGVVAIPRPFLSYIDWTFHRRLDLPWAPLLAAGLVVAAFGVAFLLRRLAAPAAVAHVARTSRSLAGLLVVVASLWLLNTIGPIDSAAFSILYSARWFLFGAVFATGVRQYELLRLSDASERPIRVAIAVAAVVAGVSELAIVLAGIPGLDTTEAVLSSAATIGVGSALVVALRDATPRSAGELPWRRVAAYRAHVELGKTPAELAALRDELGVSEREAREVERVVAVEKAAGPATRVELEEGELALGRYRVERFLGAGTFGRVFLARDEVAAGERVVLKELSPAWRHDAAAVEQFRREAEVALRVHHPNLVAFRSIERAGDGHVLVLQYVEGDTLRQRLARSGPLAPATVARVGRDVAAALAALHARGIVHRDVKPDNIVLGPDDRATLLNFGAALDVSGGSGTAPAAHPGTRGYMAPEQAAGGRVTPASDVYALGATLREALGATLRGSSDEAWRACLDRALDADPARRWPSAEAFAASMPEGSYVRAS